MPKSKKRKDAKGKPVRRKNIPRFQPATPKADKQGAGGYYPDRSSFDSDDDYFDCLDIPEAAEARAKRNALAYEIESRSPRIRPSKEEENLPLSLWRVRTDDDDLSWNFDLFGSGGSTTLAHTEQEAVAIVLGKKISAFVDLLRGCDSSEFDHCIPPKTSECHAIMLAGPETAPGRLHDWQEVFFSLSALIYGGWENNKARMEARRLLTPFASGFERELPSVRDEVRTEIERLIRLGDGVLPLMASIARLIFFIEPEAEKLSSEISFHQEDVRSRKRI